MHPIDDTVRIAFFMKSVFWRWSALLTFPMRTSITTVLYYSLEWVVGITIEEETFPLLLLHQSISLAAFCSSNNPNHSYRFQNPIIRIKQTHNPCRILLNRGASTHHSPFTPPLFTSTSCTCWKPHATEHRITMGTSTITRTVITYSHNKPSAQPGTCSA